MNYQTLIESKEKLFESKGFEISLESLNPKSFGEKHQFQPHIIQWALKLGKAAVFSSFGTGKTAIECHWANQVARHTGGKVLLLAPLAVADQTVEESKKFGIDVVYCKNQEEVDLSDAAIVITNYDRVESFDPSKFVGVALDESSILKNWSGKTSTYLRKAFQDTPYKICLSALPSPNDYLELQSHAEFLNVADKATFISRYFQNNAMKAGGYTLKPCAEKHFWRWMSSWSVCLVLPSDLGFSDEGWQMPEHKIEHHIVAADHQKTLGKERDRDGQFLLIRSNFSSATKVHQEQRINLDRLVAKVKTISDSIPESEPTVIWCFTDYESEAISSEIEGAIQLKGSDSLKEKRIKLLGFAEGAIPRFITKPEIAGLGMNWQHSAYQIFLMGTSYSFEQYFQALFRLYRFGQKRTVQTHLIYAETANSVRDSLARKEIEFEKMRSGLRSAMKEAQLKAHFANGYDDYKPQQIMRLPRWIYAQQSGFSYVN